MCGGGGSEGGRWVLGDRLPPHPATTPTQVRYHIATPWTKTKYVEQVRKVQVVDTNECKRGDGRHGSDVKDDEACPDCVPRCSAEASCVNTIGSYECEVGWEGRGVRGGWGGDDFRLSTRGSLGVRVGGHGSGCECLAGRMWARARGRAHVGPLPCVRSCTHLLPLLTLSLPTPSPHLPSAPSVAARATASTT